MNAPITAVLIGAGDRGAHAYAPYALAHPEQIRFVAVAEPNEVRRGSFGQAHGIPLERQFPGWEELLAQGQLADVAFVTTLDHLHFAPTHAALLVGYNVFLEKPMATTIEDCVSLVATARQEKKLLHISHELRYTDFFTKLNEIVKSGQLGQIISVQFHENLVYWSSTHSFVRGHWRNSQLECPKVLAKGCHDLDLIYWMFGPCKQLSSFGSLAHFRKENAPPGAPYRCTDDCPVASSCPYYAPRMYVELIPLIQSARRSGRWWERMAANFFLEHPDITRILRSLIHPLDRALDYRGWPVSTISEDSSVETRLLALQTGPWGRCVYHCDNDVVDHQTICLEMESGVSVNLVMNGHSHEEAREIRIDGSQATVKAKFTDGLGDDHIEIHNKLDGRRKQVSVARSRKSHGGGDEKIMFGFIQAVRESSTSLTSAEESLESHLMAFAAELSRLNTKIVQMPVFRDAAWSYHPQG